MQTIPNRPISPRNTARWAGALFLLTIAGGVAGTLIAGDQPTDPATIRIAYSLFMIEMSCQIATTTLMYQLLRPVNSNAALFMAVFGYAGATVKIVARIFLYSLVFVKSGPDIAFLMNKINAFGSGTACIFLGISTVFLGFLMLRSGFLPRFLGYLGIISGIGWSTFVYPPFSARIFMPLALFALVDSAILIAWLLVKGVDEAAWVKLGSAA